MKKVLLKVYLNENLGDDLFAYIFLKRYANKFSIYNKYEYKSLNNIENLNFVGTNFSINLDRIFKKLFSIYDYTETLNKKKYDLLLYIGGSLFIEGNSLKFWTVNSKQYLKNYIPYYILGSNVGPYIHEEFLEILKNNIFNKAEDVCFREENSYKLFKSLPNVRYASDIVFTLDTSNINITNDKKVVISVIDCDKKINPKYTGLYEKKVIELIKLFYNKGYEITLMSYCKSEGDEYAIERIIAKLDNEKIKENINKYFYDGNIEEALNIMGDCQVIIGTRFHANIIGLVMNKTVIPIAYSDKTLNVLKDMNFKGKVFDIRDMDNFKVDSITDDDLNYKIDVSYQKKDAQRQFEKLDKILNRRENNE